MPELTTYRDHMHTAITQLRERTDEQLEAWAMSMHLTTEPDHRHLLRMVEGHSDMGMMADPANMANVTLWMETEPPTFWCDLPADHPARARCRHCGRTIERTSGIHGDWMHSDTRDETCRQVATVAWPTASPA